MTQKTVSRKSLTTLQRDVKELAGWLRRQALNPSNKLPSDLHTHVSLTHTQSHTHIHTESHTHTMAYMYMYIYTHIHTLNNYIFKK